jgi:hypothetical protein
MWKYGRTFPREFSVEDAVVMMYDIELRYRSSRCTISKYKTYDIVGLIWPSISGTIWISINYDIEVSKYRYRSLKHRYR